MLLNARVVGSVAWSVVVLPALLASTAIAWRMWAGGYEVPAEPVVGSVLYAPWDAFRWARDFGFDPAFRWLFWQGVGLAFLPGVLAVGLLGLKHAAGGGWRARAGGDQARHMGSADELLKHGGAALEGDGVVLGGNGKRDRSAGSTRVVRAVGDQHVMILGPTRAGKGIGCIVPTLLEHRGSILVHDPKAELAAITSRHRGTLGPCWVIDPTNPHADRFNPLLEMRSGEHLVGACQMVARLLVNTSTDYAPKEPFWDEAAAHILTALLVQVCTSDERTLAHLFRLALDIDRGVYPAPPASALVRDVIAGHQAREERVRSNINATIISKLHWLSDPLIQTATSRSDFRASDLVAGPASATVYLTIPVADADRLRPLTRLMLQATLKPLLHDVRVCADGRRKERGLLMLLDEFPQLGRMDVLEHGLSVCAGYGVRAALVAQDVDQISAVYGDDESITANMGTIALLPGFSKSSLEVTASWAGWAMQEARSRGREAFKPLAIRLQESEQQIPVLNPAEMVTRGREEILVFARGCRPVWLRRLRYYEQDRWRGMWDGA